MSSINNIGNSNATNRILNTPVHKQVPAQPPAQLPLTDRLELSGVSHLMKALKSSSDVRTDKIAAIKAQIEAGTYEDDAKLNVAVDRLIDDLSK